MFEHLLADLEQDVFVIHQEDSPLFVFYGGRWSRLHLLPGSLGGHWQENVERTAFPKPALDPQPPLQALHNPMNHG